MTRSHSCVQRQHSVRSSPGILQLLWRCCQLQWHLNDLFFNRNKDDHIDREQGVGGTGYVSDPTHTHTHFFVLLVCECANIGASPGHSPWSPHSTWFLRPTADAGLNTFADMPARKTFMMKCEAGKREVRTNRDAVFFKPLFYFADRCPESTHGCHRKHESLRKCLRACCAADCRTARTYTRNTVIRERIGRPLSEQFQFVVVFL